ncbi:MAG: FkbM family methyltransferase [Candidatus Hermodarchaeota archaeon]
MSIIKNEINIIKILKNWPTYFADLFHATKQEHILYELRNGVRYKVRAKTHDKIIINEIWVRNQYTPPGFKINPSDTVVDIGSHIGIFAVFASKYAYKGKVYSFEPIPENFGLLNENISLNNIKNLIPFNKAVTNKKGRIKMRVYENTGGHSLVFNHSNCESKTLTIETTSLKDFVEEKNISKIDFLKMDCEGGEYDIFFNCPDYIFRMIGLISMEYHNIDEKRNAVVLKKFLEEKGFSVKLISEGRLPYTNLYAKR